mmetsp:Transcript_17885/g.33146  ORF Transcript_17885/g.33146 Transcript_17885/m.33146 type:complete len:122 (-) Transcript_17885:887-1252(-)
MEHYPNLAICKVRLTGSAATARPPVVLPRNVREAAADVSFRNDDEDCYDFSLERHILKRKEERDQDQILYKASSRDELQSSTINKMKNVTGAEEDVCVAILESNSYDLKMSIETFFLQNGA